MAGFFGLFNYAKPGKGVDKNAPEKKRFFYFFELFGRKFWKLIQLNLIFILFSIPIVTIGPAYVAMCKVMKDLVNERGVFLFSDFFEAFKKNFKQSVIFWIVDLVVLAVFSVCIPFYYNMTNDNGFGWILFGLSACLMFIWFLINCYMFVMLPIMDMKLIPMLKNAFYLSILGLKSNLCTFFAILLVAGGTVFLFLLGPVPILVSFLLFFTVLFSLCAFITTFNCYPLVNKFIIEPYYEKTGEQRPDEFHFDESEFDDMIFEDIGTKEVAAKTSAPTQKSKTIK